MQDIENEKTGGPDGPTTLREGLEMFIAALQSGVATTRTAALKLFRSGLMPENQDRLVAMLAGDLDSRDRARGDAAAETLTAIGLPALGVVGMRAALGKKPAVRVRAVEILGAICVTHRLPPGFALSRALGDNAPAVRRAAEEACQAIGEAAARAGPHACGLGGARSLRGEEGEGGVPCPRDGRLK